MDSKISSKIWGHEPFDVFEPDLKLAVLWMLTNGQLTYFGYAETSARRMAFETGLDPKTFDRAIEALPKTFTRTSHGYFVRNYIRRQIGAGPSLVRNHLCKPLVRALVGLSDNEVLMLVKDAYPELIEAIEKEALGEGMPTPPGVVRVRVRERERVRAQDRGAGGRGTPTPDFDPSKEHAHTGGLTPLN